MNIKNHIRKVLRESVENRSKSLYKFARKHGLESAVKMIGGLEKYIDVVYGGDLFLFYKHEPEIKPYEIKGTTPNMFVSDLLVQSLNLPERHGDKILGNFKYGTRKSMPNNVEVKLTEIRLGNERIWKVIASGGGKGFGTGYMSDENIFGPKYRMQIFKQIIEKYGWQNLKK